jgi:GcrA cell cycle regulator
MEWNEQRVETLRQLWGQGQTASQIATILGGVTRNAVIGKAHRLGLTARPSPIKRDGLKPAQARRKASPAISSVSLAKMSNAILRGAVLPPHAKAEERRNDPNINRPSMTARFGKSASGGRSACSWPIGDPKTADFHFCGESNEPGRPYCATHCAQAYQRKSDAA